MLIGAHQDESFVTLQCLAGVIAKCCRKQALRRQANGHIGEQRIDCGMCRQMGERIAHAHNNLCLPFDRKRENSADRP